MLQFLIHDPKGPSAEYPPLHAHLLGRDDQPVPGAVAYRDGRLVCTPEFKTATALALEIDASPSGRLILQTCLLQQRDEPYLLNLELARHRIKQYIAKGEEWLLFDPVSGGESFKLWERARTLFVHAMNEPDPVSAEGKARESLIAALEASERLAIMQSELALKRRYRRTAASSTLIGVRVDPTLDPAVCGAAAMEFDVVAVQTPWALIEPTPGTFHFEQVDRWMALAVQSKRPIVAGALLHFDPASLPTWMQQKQPDFKSIVDRSYSFMEKVVHRYQSIVTIWNVGSDLHANAWFPFNDTQRIDITRRASLLVRQSRKGARTLVELTDLFGENIVRQKNAITAWQFLERLIQEGIHLDAVGLQLRMGGGAAGYGVRDMLQISSVLDRFAGFDCKVMLSAIGVPSAPTAQGGWWRKPWSAATQEQWSSSLATVALSKPWVETLVWERLVDVAGDPRGTCGLLESSYQSKLVARKLLAIRNRLRKPLATTANKKVQQPLPEEVNDETAAGAPPA